MKSLMSALTVLLLSTSAFADYVNFDGIGSVPEITEKAVSVTPKAIPMTQALRDLVIQSLDYQNDEFQCDDKDIARTEFITEQGNLYYAVHTAEDYCDGGNSYGVVVDKNQAPLAWIRDGDFYPLDLKSK